MYNFVYVCWDYVILWFGNVCLCVCVREGTGTKLTWVQMF